MGRIRSLTVGVLGVSAILASSSASAEPTPRDLLCGRKSGKKPSMVLRPAVFPHDATLAEVPASSRAIETVTDGPTGAGLLRMLGPHAASVLAPATGLVGALVHLPRGVSAESLGLLPASPGLGRLRAPAATVDAFALAHPELRLEIGPPLYPLMDRVRELTHTTQAHARGTAGATGKGVFIGVADTGIDVLHHEFRDANGKSRIRWLLDLSMEPVGRHPELERRFAVEDKNHGLHGAVFSNEDLDELIADVESGCCAELDAQGFFVKQCAPTDDKGHGTHVTGIAAGSGDRGPKIAANGQPLSQIYGGVAPEADIVFVRISRPDHDGMENDDFVLGAQFLFDRADAEHRPMVANFSLGSDYGPHDGTTAWEREVASHVGPDKPGHAIVVAAGNSGSVAQFSKHQTVRVSGSTVRVPLHANGTPFSTFSGSVKIWVAEHPGSDLRIGLEAPGDQVWITPVPYGKQRGRIDQNGKKTISHSGVIHGASAYVDGGNPIPPDSRGAVVLWKGDEWPWGRYDVVLEGTGTVDLYVDGTEAGGGVSFPGAVRESTVNLPATHPALIAVGSTVNRTQWTSIDGQELKGSHALFDDVGGRQLDNGGDENVPTRRPLFEGEVSEYSSAGPTVTGVQKPEIAAPGENVISAMSRSAVGAFTGGLCPSFNPGGGRGPHPRPHRLASGTDNRCRQIDPTHGLNSGTSMASPVVAGVVALLLERDPTLTQEQIKAVLQAGAHRFRGPAPFDDQSGPGEVDAVGALDALEQMRNPALALPSLADSWLTLSSSYVLADGTRPITAILELRTTGAVPADAFGVGRITPVVLVDGVPTAPLPAVQRRAPGVYVFSWTPPPGLGGRRATLGATFDGQPIVAPKELPIASDPWVARYPSHATGNTCSVRAVGRSEDGDVFASMARAWLGVALVGAVGAARASRRRRRPHGA